MKRGADSQYSNVESSNGSGSYDSGGGFKKARVEPSRVLHFREVPSEANEREIVELGIPFGRMTNLLFARKKNQAMLEMADLAAAEAMYYFFSKQPPQIRGRTVYIQYSNHQALKTEPTSAVNAGARAALAEADRIQNGGGRGDIGGTRGSDGGGRGNDGGGRYDFGEEEEGVSRSGTQRGYGDDGGRGRGGAIIKAGIDNMLYPITVEILHKIFTKFGQVLRIVTFQKNSTGNLQAYIEYSNAREAQDGFENLNGQNIYNGCCTLRLEITRMDKLDVRYNNDKMRDYTNPNLPSGENRQQMKIDPVNDGLLGAFESSNSSVMGGFPGLAGLSNNAAAGLNIQAAIARLSGGSLIPGALNNLGSGMSGAMMGALTGGLGGGIGSNIGGGIGTGLNASSGSMGIPSLMSGLGGGAREDLGRGMGGISGGLGGIGGGVNSVSGIMNLMNSGLGAATPMGRMMSAIGVGLGQMGGIGSIGGIEPMGDEMDDYDRRQYGGSSRDRDGGNVIIVSNLDKERITPDLLYNLFGNYGIVKRVKILFNKRDTALIQYADAEQADNAIEQLDRCMFWGKALKVSMSKHSHIQMPSKDASDAWMTKDYTNSMMCRFKKMKGVNVHNLRYPPSSTLHLSNIPGNTTEEELKDLFNEQGTVVAFKFFKNDRKMALVQLRSAEEAVNALVMLHNHELPTPSGKYNLRVSFTKSHI